MFTHCWVTHMSLVWVGLLSRSHIPQVSRPSFLCLLSKLGIQDFKEQSIGSHQSFSRKTLIALVTSGILLAVLGITGYFLMNRRSWSPTGERLVSSGVRATGNEEDRGLLGQSTNVMSGEEKYRKRHFLCPYHRDGQAYTNRVLGRVQTTCRVGQR